ncbi:ATP-binding cassette domain-containing protein [Piscibacillus salipiscarius]|uniref:ATP-binding cassette domain-containing protein n=1 Tax=Piscibacillus salipiscarius TaxID=299480 RepID=UPI0024371BFB|nr:ATP-binding cassette domain-containing protein [Piscibacillus salipiscarius]
MDFSYDRYKTVLENINLNIHTGETVAFVGPSGAGKSTICSLIPRFYDVNNGSITIDGIDIKGMTKITKTANRYCATGCLSIYRNSA